MDLTPALWQDAQPELWRRAASDWRALAASDAADRHGRQKVADALGYASANKISNLRSDASALRSAAAAGDQDALDRIARAEALGRILTNPQPGL